MSFIAEEESHSAKYTAMEMQQQKGDEEAAVTRSIPRRLLGKLYFVSECKVTRVSPRCLNWLSMFPVTNSI